MKYLPFLLFLFLVPMLSLAQNSRLYHTNGMLVADTTLQITPVQYLYWSRAEEQVVARVASYTMYPRQAQNAEIGGRVIVAFDCDQDSVRNIRIVRGLGAGLDEAVVGSVRKTSGFMIAEFNYLQREVLPEKHSYSGTYYLAIDFILKKFDEEFQKNNAVPVIELSRPRLQGRTD